MDPRTRGEGALLEHLRDLLLELGRGFAFVGSQVPPEADGQTFYIDMWQKQPQPQTEWDNLKSSHSCLHNSRI
jgi:predicted nuclease of restriction endonuclease-like (RecB) superfamily